ncbi:MAG: type II toxin-antitoxin system RelE/ParE family toxin [Myxococcaceae bacterium]
MKIAYYRRVSGAEPVRDYLDHLSDKDLAIIQSALEDVEANGLQAPTVTMRHIEGKLWELKISAHRIFYVVIDGPIMVLLHAYRKQGQKAPKRELRVALDRMKEVLNA